LVVVQATSPVSPRLLRVTLTGDELDGLVVEDPAASVRLLLPSPGTDELVMPAWNGNEFLLSDGRRPILRTFTPRRVDAVALEVDVDVVLHDGGVASGWATAAQPGDAVAVSGPGRGYAIDPDAPAYFLAGDETAIPAITQLLEAIPRDTPVQVHIEIASPDARLELAAHPTATVEWHQGALFDAIRAADIATGTRIWAAGEAAAMQRIRRHLFDERGIPRAHATVRGYWKHGRTGDDDGD
jgi:NADPH-dependent ferric siderophore reductase